MQGGPSVAAVATLANLSGLNADYGAHVDTNICNYYYTGQSNNSGDTIPFFSYAPVTGMVTRSTQAIP